MDGSERREENITWKLDLFFLLSSRRVRPHRSHYSLRSERSERGENAYLGPSSQQLSNYLSRQESERGERQDPPFSYFCTVSL